MPALGGGHSLLSRAYLQLGHFPDDFAAAVIPSDFDLSGPEQDGRCHCGWVRS
jgi:hypothetical protein